MLAEPNPEMTGLTFRETLQAHALLYGNAFAELVRDGTGRVVQAWPIHPLNVMVYRETDTGTLSYRVTVAAFGGPPGNLGEQIELAPENVLHIPGLSPDGSTGYRLLTVARETLGFGQSAMGYGASFFRNACRPAGILNHPMKLSDQGRENLRKSYDLLHAGTDNAGRMLITEEGMTFTPVQINNEQSQYQQLLEFYVREVARFLLIPPHLLMDLADAKWANITEQNRDYLGRTLRPWLERWEHEMERKCLTRAERDAGYFIEFDTSSLLRADQATRYAAYAVALAGQPFRTINEVRAEENLPPIDAGDVLASDQQPGDQGTDQGEQTAAPGAPPADAAPVQDTALSGIQITALLGITDKVVNKAYPPEAAVQIIAAAFPAMNPEQIKAFVGALAAAPTPEAPAAPAPQPPDEQPAEDKTTDQGDK